MVYSKQTKLVAVLTCNGKILREFRDENGEDVVKMPFDSEYGIRIKNLNSERVSVKVFIEGKDALDNNSSVINPNESHDIEGFMKGSFIKNKFKFIQKTEQISDYRGDNIDDGIVRIEYQFEKPKPIKIKKIIEESKIIKEKKEKKYPPYDPWRPYPPYDPWRPSPPHDPWRPYPPYDPWRPYCTLDDTFVSDTTDSKDNFNINSTANVDSILRSINMNYNNFTPKKEEGITTKGSQTNIEYKDVILREMEEVSHVCTIKIVGYNKSNKNISKPITVKNKIQCETCGTKNKSNNKFCSNCGTSLI